jgi:acyl carrier protein
LAAAGAADALLLREQREAPELIDSKPHPVAPTRDTFAAQLVHFVNEVLPEVHTRLAQRPNVDRGTPLFETGLIDSLAIVHLIAFVEGAIGRKIPTRQVVMKHFRTIDAICDTFGPGGGNEAGSEHE